MKKREEEKKKIESKKIQSNSSIQISMIEIIDRMKKILDFSFKNIRMIEKSSYISFFNESNEKILQLIKSKNQIHFDSFKKIDFSDSIRENFEREDILSNDEKLRFHHSRIFSNIYLKSEKSLESFLSEYIKKYSEKKIEKKMKKSS